MATTLISRLMLNLQNPRLFQVSGAENVTTLTTLGAFVPPEVKHGEYSSDVSSEGTWCDETAQYSTWNYEWNEGGGSPGSGSLGIATQQDIG